MRNFKITDLMISMPSVKNQQPDFDTPGGNALHPHYYDLEILDADCHHHTKPDCVDAKTSACNPCTQTTPDCGVDAKTSGCTDCTQTSPDCDVHKKTSQCSDCTQTTPHKTKGALDAQNIEASSLLADLKIILAKMKSGVGES